MDANIVAGHRLAISRFISFISSFFRVHSLFGITLSCVRVPYTWTKFSQVLSVNSLGIQLLKSSMALFASLSLENSTKANPLEVKLSLNFGIHTFLIGPALAKSLASSL